MTTECEHLLEGFVLPSVVLSAEGVLLFANAAWSALCGDASREAWAWLDAISVEERAGVRTAIERAIGAQRPVEVEFDVRTQSGAPHTLCVTLGPVELGESSGFLGVARDVSASRRREQRLVFMAGHDPLTGLANRHTFSEALERSASLATTRGVPSMLVLLDMDHLKRYNDAFGHLEGDQALVNLSMLLRSHIRASDLAARIGGDEFALLLNGATLADADDIASRICEAARGEFVAGARQVQLGVSGGIAEVEANVDPRVIMDRADSAMYASKQGGRHRFIKWDQGLGELATSNLSAGRVREALGNHGLFLVFQPVVSLKDGSVSYYESLVRMEVAEGESLLPSAFLPTVERIGLEPRLTLRVLELALAAIAKHPGICLSVNLSATDLTDTALREDVEATIRSSGVEPSSVVFEIPESTLLSNLSEGRQWIERLAATGCRFVLDDFGAGLGVFVLLNEDHIEQVKLSRTVIEALRHSKESRQFVRAIRELIESQGKSTVAAFIETEAMLAEVVDAGFTFSQGYALHEPEADLDRLIGMMRRVHGF